MSGIVGCIDDDNLICVDCCYSCPAYEEELYCTTGCPNWFKENCPLCNECEFREKCKRECENGK